MSAASAPILSDASDPATAAIGAAPDSRAVFAGFGIRRPPAFAAAGRHSQRVRFLRRAIIVVCVATVGLLGFVWMFDPLNRMRLGLSIGSVGISGTKVTMRDPKLSGLRRDGHAYEMKATTATQDTTITNIINLEGVDLRLSQADGTTTHITALTGLYDTDADRLDLAGSVRFLNEGHYDMALGQAVMNLKGGEISTQEPAVVTVPGGRIASDRLNFAETSRIVLFDGHVRSVFTQDGEPLPDLEASR